MDLPHTFDLDGVVKRRSFNLIQAQNILLTNANTAANAYKSINDVVSTYANVVEAVQFEGGATPGQILALSQGVATPLLNVFASGAIPVFGPAVAIISLFLPNADERMYNRIMTEVNNLVQRSILDSARQQINSEMSGFIYALSFGNAVTESELFLLRQRAPLFFGNCWNGAGNTVTYGISCQAWQNAGSVAQGMQFTVLHMSVLLDMAIRAYNANDASTARGYLEQLGKLRSSELALHRASLNQFERHRINSLQAPTFRNVRGTATRPYRLAVTVPRDNYGAAFNLDCGNLPSSCGARTSSALTTECAPWRRSWSTCFNNYRGRIQTAINRMRELLTNLELVATTTL
jgi:hypothetical protein